MKSTETKEDTLTEGFLDYNKDIDELEDELDKLYNEKEELLGYEDSKDELVELEKEIYELETKLDNIRKQQKVEYENEIKDLPKETTKTNFEGFRTDTTGLSCGDDYLKSANPEYYDYCMAKKSYTNSYIAEMTPEEYLKLCSKYVWKKPYKGLDDIFKHMFDQESVKEYADKMKNGTKFDMPYINIKGAEQEGRHRVLAALEAGIKTIPVLVII